MLDWCKKLFTNEAYSHVLIHHGIYVPQGVFAETVISFELPITTWHTAYREKTFLLVTQVHIIRP